MIDSSSQCLARNSERQIEQRPYVRNCLMSVFVGLHALSEKTSIDLITAAAVKYDQGKKTKKGYQ